MSRSQILLRSSPLDARPTSFAGRGNRSETTTNTGTTADGSETAKVAGKAAAQIKMKKIRATGKRAGH